MYVNTKLREGADPVSPVKLFPWFREEDEQSKQASPDEVSQGIINLFSTFAKKPEGTD